MSISGKLADDKIRKAMAEGAFRNLQGQGKPLNLEEDAGVPEDLRMTYKILKNAGVLPPEMEMRKEVLRLEELVALCEDEKVANRYRESLTLKRLQLELAMQRSGLKLGKYHAAVYQKITGS